MKTVRTVGAEKLLTAECARVIHSEVSSHSDEVAVKYVETDSHSERVREQFLNGTSAHNRPLHGLKIQNEIYLTMIRRKM